MLANHDLVSEVFYSTDYHSHLGTKRGGFEDELLRFKGNSGIGVISDTDSQPILLNSHLGMFVLVTVSRINNMDELTARFLAKGGQFLENSQGLLTIQNSLTS